MARRRWTLLVLPDDQSGVRQFVLSEPVVRGAAVGGLVVLATLVSLAVGFFVKEDQRRQADQLVTENAILASQLEEIRGRMSTLQESLDELSRRDEHYRLLAGLDPLDEEVRLAGIGGPGTETVQANPLWRENPELGQATFAAAYDLNTLIRRARLLSNSWREATETLEDEHRRLGALPSILPTQGYLSSGFTRSRWHPILHRPRPHEGIDVSAPRGTPILAAANGRVSFVGRKGDYGLTVEIDHGNGIVTRYAHASRTHVRQWQQVERGHHIADVGSTGLAIGPHLHYEVLVNGRPQNPRNYIFDQGPLP